MEQGNTIKLNSFAGSAAGAAEDEQVHSQARSGSAEGSKQATQRGVIAAEKAGVRLLAQGDRSSRNQRSGRLFLGPSARNPPVAPRDATAQAHDVRRPVNEALDADLAQGGTTTLIGARFKHALRSLFT